jgi:hypothetical protein
MAIRVAIPLAAYADAGSSLPGLPEFQRRAQDGGLMGDATGFYAATREFMAAWGRMPRPVLALTAVFAVAAAIAVVATWQRRPGLAPMARRGCRLRLRARNLRGCALDEPTGAAVFGWSLFWALPMLAYRALGFGLSKHVAWDFGVALSLVCVALTVVAVAYLGRNASARRWVGLLAAAFWTAWPLLVGVIAGHGAWENFQWNVDVGLHNYSEPLSTLLVTAGAALMLSPQLSQMRLCSRAARSCGDARQASRTGCLRRRRSSSSLPARPNAEAIPVPRSRAVSGSSRAGLLAAVVSEALRQSAVVAA